MTTNQSLVGVARRLASEYQNSALFNDYVLQYLLAHQRIRQGRDEFEKYQCSLLNAQIISDRIPYETFQSGEALRAKFQQILKDARVQLQSNEIQALTRPVQYMLANQF